MDELFFHGHCLVYSLQADFVLQVSIFKEYLEFCPMVDLLSVGEAFYIIGQRVLQYANTHSLLLGQFIQL